MFPIQVFVLLQALSVGIVSASHFQSKTLDCSAVTDIVNLDRYKDLCTVVHNWGDSNEPLEFSRPNRLDIVEMCTCNLLRHQLVWESMMTHELDTLFLASRKLIESKVGDEVAVKEDHVMFQQDERGEQMYFWDSFNKVLHSIDVRIQGPDYSDELLGYFAEIYYQPESFTMPFKVQTRMGISALLKLVSEVCRQMRSNFDTYFTYFKNLKELSGNPRFFFRIASYDENLFKLFSVRNICEFMSFAGSLI